jgi:four helix bundle protein
VVKKYKVDLYNRAFLLSRSLIVSINKLPRQEATVVIARQLIRSGTSIGANIMEAKSASSRLEFKRYHEIALKSANESRYWLALLIDVYPANTDFPTLLSETEEIGNMLSAGILKLKEKL